MIGFDPQLIHDALFTGVNVFILFFALSYLLFNPVRDVLERRRQKIADELTAAAADKESAAKLMAEYQAKLNNVEKEAEGILEKARRKAKAKEAEILGEAKAESARIMERTSREIQLEKSKAVDEMKQEVISIAALMAEKVVAGSINIQSQDALFEETLKDMGDSTWQS